MAPAAQRWIFGKRIPSPLHTHLIPATPSAKAFVTATPVEALTPRTDTQEYAIPTDAISTRTAWETRASTAQA